MTLDQVIEYERKQYKSYKHDAQIMANMGAMESAITNIEAVAERHEQIADYLEGLKPYLYRNSENDKDLKGYLYLLWHTLYYNQIFNYTENETEVIFTFTHKTYDAKTEKLINK